MNIVIFTRHEPPCPYCEGAKLLMSERGISYVETVIGQDMTLEEFTETYPDQRTVPLIFVDGQKIGGYQEFKQLLDQQSLQGMSL